MGEGEKDSEAYRRAFFGRTSSAGLRIHASRDSPGSRGRLGICQNEVWLERTCRVTLSHQGYWVSRVLTGTYRTF